MMIIKAIWKEATKIVKHHSKQKLLYKPFSKRMCLCTWPKKNKIFIFQFRSPRRFRKYCFVIQRWEIRREIQNLYVPRCKLSMSSSSSVSAVSTRISLLASLFCIKWSAPVPIRSLNRITGKNAFSEFFFRSGCSDWTSFSGSVWNGSGFQSQLLFTHIQIGQGGIGAVDQFTWTLRVIWSKNGKDGLMFGGKSYDGFLHNIHSNGIVSSQIGFFHQ